MKLPPFEYRAPDTIEETVSLLAEFGDEAKILAGGQSLFPLMAMRLARPTVLVDVNRVPALAGLSVQNGLRIAAMTRQSIAERSELVAQEVPMLSHALGFVAHAAIRNRGTIGGSIAHADPAAELPIVVSALDASLLAVSTRGERTIGTETFFQGFLTTALEPDELLTAIQFRASPPRSGWAFNEFSRRTGDFALVGVAVSLTLDEADAVASVRIVLSGVAGEPTRAADAEQALAGQPGSDEAVLRAAEAAARQVDPSADLHASSAYRRHLISVLVGKSLKQALARGKENRS